MKSPAESPNEITLLVFKDNFASRTFRVPLTWITQLGAGLVLLAVLTFMSFIIAFKYYRAAHRADPIRMHSLEQELNDLKSSYKALEEKQSKSLPVPSPSQAAPAITASWLFNGIPTAILPVPTDSKLIPISIGEPKVSLQGKNLSIRFGIQYSKPDEGSQQGRIILLARGPSLLMTYPEDVLNPAGKESLIQPEKGESFSVSRFREVNAQFTPVNSEDAIHEVEILIFGTLDGVVNQLLIHDKKEVHVDDTE